MDMRKFIKETFTFILIGALLGSISMNYKFIKEKHTTVTSVPMPYSQGNNNEDGLKEVHPKKHEIKDQYITDKNIYKIYQEQ